MTIRPYVLTVPLFLAALPLFANPSAVPIPIIGTAYVDFTGNNSYNTYAYPSSQLIGPYNDGYGGAFNPVVSSVNSSGQPLPPSYLTTVWCVDYQLNVTTESAYTADITPLSSLPADDSAVRYGNLDSVSPPAPGWSNTLSDPTGSDGNDPNSAAYRYTLAAALVSQYQDSNGNADPANLVNSSQNQAIQEAIWYITANNEYYPGSPSTGTSDGPYTLPNGTPACGVTFDANNPLCWVNYAETNVTSVTTKDWAVISGPADPAGTFPNNLGNPTSNCPTCANYNSFQTFLVQLTPGTVTSQTPEPAFYLVLGIGLAGLVFVRRIKRA